MKELNEGGFNENEINQFSVSQPPIDETSVNFTESMNVSIDHFTISCNNKVLFDDTDLQLVFGKKYGLIGQNGAGKSTLLRMINNGSLIIPPKLSKLYVEQEIVGKYDENCLQSVLKSNTQRQSYIKKLIKLELKLKALDEENEDVVEDNNLELFFNEYDSDDDESENGGGKSDNHGVLESAEHLDYFDEDDHQLIQRYNELENNPKELLDFLLDYYNQVSEAFQDLGFYESEIGARKILFGFLESIDDYALSFIIN